AEAMPGLGPNTYEAYLQAARTYPASSIPQAVVARAKQTFTRIANRDAKLRKAHSLSFLWSNQWKLLAPRINGTHPGVTSFSGATNNPGSRITALLVDPKCSEKKCRVWAGASGGGVWLTTDALAPSPSWKQTTPPSLDQNSVGTLSFDPSDK